MAHHKYTTPKKEEAKHKAASPSKKTEDEILGKKKGKRDYSILRKIWKGYKAVKKLGKKNSEQRKKNHANYMKVYD